MNNSLSIALRLFIGLVAFSIMQPASAQPTRQPGPQITGYDWDSQWVTALNSCTKNTLGQYEALIYVSNDGTSPYKVQSLAITGPDAAYFKFDNSDPATSITPLPGLEIRPGDPNKRSQKVLFTPDAERIYMAMVRLTTDSGNVVEAFLQGMAIESHIDLDGKDFGTIEFKGAETTVVSGNAILISKPTRPTTITELRITGADAGDFKFNWGAARAPYNSMPTSASPWLITPITEILIPIDFAPGSPGSKTAQLEVTGDFSKCDTSAVALMGNAVTSLSVSGSIDTQVAISADRTGIFTISLPQGAPVTLDLYDATGTIIVRLAEGMMETGTHRITGSNRELASGLYLYRLNAGGTIKTGRVVVVR